MTTCSIDDTTNLDILNQLTLIYRLSNQFDGNINFKSVLSDVEFIYLLIFLVENEFMYLVQRKTANPFNKNMCLHTLNRCLKQEHHLELSMYHLDYLLGIHFHHVILNVPKKDRSYSMILDESNTMLNEIYFYCTGKPYDPISFPHIPRRNPENK